jgi:predicted aspartyl protease
VSLPWRLAGELSLSPAPTAPKVRCSLADGRAVDAHRVVATNMRVGKFAADNVECIVLPAELDDAPPLLGMSFLGNYSFRIDPQAATMTLIRVEVPGAQRGKPKKLAN